MRYRNYFEGFCIKRAHRGRRRERAGPKGTEPRARSGFCRPRPRLGRTVTAVETAPPGLEACSPQTWRDLWRLITGSTGDRYREGRSHPRRGRHLRVCSHRPGIRGTKDGPGVLTGTQATNGSPPFSPIMGRPARSQDCMPPPTLIASQPTWFSQAAACAERPPRRQIT
jgi:hypothetical protein